MVQPVSDIGSNAEENIAHAAKIIGRSTHRRMVFEAIYKGKTKIKKVSELISATDLLRTRVLDAGKRLVDNRIIKQTKKDGETAYEKVPFFAAHKRKILKLVDSPLELAAYPTKRNPKQIRLVQLLLLTKRAQTQHLTIDDIELFRLVRLIDNNTTELGDVLSENEFKRGLQKILKEGGRFKDWGGEKADLFTTNFRVNRRRRPVAFALKGPGTRGKLTPGKMGKNGDQIQRLFETPAEVFLVQYCRQVESTVLTQMKLFAIAKSLMTGTRVFYGIIDGRDSQRLVRAYPDAFKRTPHRL